MSTTKKVSRKEHWYLNPFSLLASISFIREVILIRSPVIVVIFKTLMAKKDDIIYIISFLCNLGSLPLVYQNWTTPKCMLSRQSYKDLLASFRWIHTEFCSCTNMTLYIIAENYLLSLVHVNNMVFWYSCVFRVPLVQERRLHLRLLFITWLSRTMGKLVVPLSLHTGSVSTLIFSWSIFIKMTNFVNVCLIIEQTSPGLCTK